MIWASVQHESGIPGERRGILALPGLIQHCLADGRNLREIGNKSFNSDFDNIQ